MVQRRLWHTLSTPGSRSKDPGDPPSSSPSPSLLLSSLPFTRRPACPKGSCWRDSSCTCVCEDPPQPSAAVSPSVAPLVSALQPPAAALLESAVRLPASPSGMSYYHNEGRHDWLWWLALQAGIASLLIALTPHPTQSQYRSGKTVAIQHVAEESNCVWIGNHEQHKKVPSCVRFNSEHTTSCRVSFSEIWSKPVFTFAERCSDWLVCLLKCNNRPNCVLFENPKPRNPEHQPLQRSQN